MRNRGKLFDWAGLFRGPEPLSDEMRMVNARRRIFGKMHDLEARATIATQEGRALRAQAGQATGMMRGFLLWRAHRLENHSRNCLRTVVALRRGARAAGIDAVGHRVARRDAFRDFEGDH